ncbi:hypothetical protein ES705_18382 [subsurface metagenome]
MTEKQKEMPTVYDVKLPEELILRLQDNTRKEDEARWDDGDITADLVDEFGDVFGKLLVRKRIAIEAELGTSTIRQREEMSRFYDSDLRAEFGSDKYPGFDGLSWSQLRAIKPAGRSGWKALARWAIKSADDFGGRVAPVDAIIAHRLGKGSPALTWEDRFVRAWNLFDEIVVDDDAPGDLVEAAQAFQDKTEQYWEIHSKAEKEEPEKKKSEPKKESKPKPKPKPKKK